MTTASRGTSLVGNSVRVAARELKADLAAGKTLAELAGREYRGEWVCDWTTKVGVEPPPGKEIVTHYSYGYAAQMVELDDTGRITRITAAHDAGRIMNPTLFEGQIEGSLHMGLGYAVTEDFPYKDGWPVSWKMADLGIIRAKDMPPDGGDRGGSAGRPRPLRRQGGGRDRPGAHRPRRGQRPLPFRRHPPHHPAAQGNEAAGQKNKS